jgi:hypothetical protein
MQRRLQRQEMVAGIQDNGSGRFLIDLRMNGMINK